MSQKEKLCIWRIIHVFAWRAFCWTPCCVFLCRYRRQAMFKGSFLSTTKSGTRFCYRCYAICDGTRGGGGWSGVHKHSLAKLKWILNTKQQEQAGELWPLWLSIQTTLNGSQQLHTQFQFNFFFQMKLVSVLLVQWHSWYLPITNGVLSFCVKKCVS